MHESVKQTLKRKPRQEIDIAMNQAYKDMLFLCYLRKQVNEKLISENRHYCTMSLLLYRELNSLLREQSLDRQMKWNQIKVEMEMPCPQDPAAAAAIDAAKRHHVLTWEALEEGDELSQWVLESFVAEGGTPLPDGAYLMRGGTNTSYMTVPTGAEVRDLFQDAQSYQKFLVSMALRGWATGAA